MSLMKRLTATLLCNLKRLKRDEQGAVTILYGLAFIAVLLVGGAAIDYSYEVQVKYQLDLAADAGAIAASQYWAQAAAAIQSGATSSSSSAACSDYSRTVTAAQAAGVAAFNAQAASLAGSATPTVTVTPTPSVASCGVSSSGAAASASAVAAVTYATTLNTFFMKIAGEKTVSVGNTSKATIQLSPYANVYLVIDTSASMTVGSTPGDIQLVSNWVFKYGCSGQGLLAKVFDTCPSKQPATANGHDTAPCGFACHEEGSLTPADMQNGLNVAASVGATTRFDVMKLALTNDPSNQYSTTWSRYSSFGEGLLPHIRDKYDNPQSTTNLNTFSYYLYGFNTDIGTNTENDETTPTACTSTCSQLGIASVANANKTTIANAINQQLSAGFGTHLNDIVLPALAATGPTATHSYPIVGVAGNGASAAAPLKFIIMITDGLHSNRNNNWNGTRTGNICSLWSAASNTKEYGTSIASVTVDECAPDTGNPMTSSTLQIWGTSTQNGGYDYTQFYNYNGCTGAYGCPWGGSASVGIAAPIDIDQSQNYPTGQNLGNCQKIRNNGVILAILETPYVPLTGQSPQVRPYENTVQSTIYPKGPNPSVPYPLGPNYPASASAVSGALFNCASVDSSGNAYYYRADTSDEIASGFISLFDQFIGNYAHLTQ